MGRFPETYNDPKFIIQRKQLGKKYMQIDISVTVISLLKSSDSFFRTCENLLVAKQDVFNSGKFPAH